MKDIMAELITKHDGPNLVIVGGDSSIQYLLQRYAAQMGYPVRVMESSSSVKTIQESEPVAVIFPSVEILKSIQSLAVELTNLDIPIIVCSSVTEQAIMRELGADYCFLHPLVFDSFSSTLELIIKSKTEKRLSREQNQGPSAVNPV
jgi:DNA-binding response OmpR family regulator